MRELRQMRERERERERQIELIIKVRPTVLPSSHVRQRGHAHGMSAKKMVFCPPPPFPVSLQAHLPWVPSPPSECRCHMWMVSFESFPSHFGGGIRMGMGTFPPSVRFSVRRSVGRSGEEEKADENETRIELRKGSCSHDVQISQNVTWKFTGLG